MKAACSRGFNGTRAGLIRKEHQQTPSGHAPTIGAAGGLPSALGSPCQPRRNQPAAGTSPRWPAVVLACQPTQRKDWASSAVKLVRGLATLMPTRAAALSCTSADALTMPACAGNPSLNAPVCSWPMQRIRKHRFSCAQPGRALWKISTLQSVKSRRVYSHLLLVVDDAEFHDASGILNPGQQRAIATTFNTLVFRTHCPAPSSEPQQQPQPAAAMVAKWAPVLLRCLQPTAVVCPFVLKGQLTVKAGADTTFPTRQCSRSDSNFLGGWRRRTCQAQAVMRTDGVKGMLIGSMMAADGARLACSLRNMYERDVRQRYCPAALWLAPYSAYAGDGHEFEAAGVVGALLHAGAVRRKLNVTSRKTIAVERQKYLIYRKIYRL